jgi:hypothetical protein
MSVLTMKVLSRFRVVAVLCGRYHSGVDVITLAGQINRANPQIVQRGNRARPFAAPSSRLTR